MIKPVQDLKWNIEFYTPAGKPDHTFNGVVAIIMAPGMVRFIDADGKEHISSLPYFASAVQTKEGE